MLVYKMQNFSQKREHRIILTNIFFKSYCLFESFKVTKEPVLKSLQSKYFSSYSMK